MKEAIARHSSLRKELGLYFPLQSFKPFKNNEDVSIQTIVNEDSEKKLYWIANPNSEQFFAERFHHFGKIPVMLTDNSEQHLIRQICHEHDITFINVSEAYFEEIKSRAKHSPLLEQLFSSVIDEDFGIVCCEDIDDRFPCVLINLPTKSQGGDFLNSLHKLNESENLESMLDKRLDLLKSLLENLVAEQSQTDLSKILVINYSNKIIKNLETEIIHGIKLQHQRFVGMLIFIAKALSDQAVDGQEFSDFVREVLSTIDNNVKDLKSKRRIKK
jgi:hypothetical protein